MVIKITEDNIIIETNEYFGCQLPVRVMRFTTIDCSDPKMKQLKQQILEDHEKAEKCDGSCQPYKMRSVYSKLEQEIKKLKEELKQSQTMVQIQEVIIKELEKKLEEKK